MGHLHFSRYCFSKTQSCTCTGGTIENSKGLVYGIKRIFTRTRTRTREVKMHTGRRAVPPRACARASLFFLAASLDLAPTAALAAWAVQIRPSPGTMQRLGRLGLCCTLDGTKASEEEVARWERRRCRKRRRWRSWHIGALPRFEGLASWSSA